MVPAQRWADLLQDVAVEQKTVRIPPFRNPASKPQYQALAATNCGTNLVMAEQ